MTIGDSESSIESPPRRSLRSKRVGLATKATSGKRTRRDGGIRKTKTKQAKPTNRTKTTSSGDKLTIFPSNTSHSFPRQRSVLILPGVDYSKISNFRHLLNKFQERGYFTFPPFILELSTLFLRCINTISHTPKDAWTNKRGMFTVARKFLLQLIAALGWIYAFGYGYRLPNNKTPVQSLGQLNQPKLFKSFLLSMEIVQLLLACARETYNIELSDVLEARIGGWFNNRIAQIKKGIWNDDYLVKDSNVKRDGIYLPFYLAFHAIHPLCPTLEEMDKNSIKMTRREMDDLLLEPQLYLTNDNEDGIRLFPKSISSGTNYNLWYFYDCLQPEPSCKDTE